MHVFHVLNTSHNAGNIVGVHRESSVRCLSALSSERPCDLPETPPKSLSLAAQNIGTGLPGQLPSCVLASAQQHTTSRVDLFGHIRSCIRSSRSCAPFVRTYKHIAESPTETYKRVAGAYIRFTDLYERFTVTKQRFTETNNRFTLSLYILLIVFVYDA